MCLKYLKNAFAALAIAATALTLVAAPSAAQTAQCGERKAIVTVLAKRFGEQVGGSGLVSGQLLLELYVSAKGTWTLLSSTPQGLSCILASGASWEKVDLPKGPEA